MNTPDTVAYLALGLAVTATIVLSFIISMVIRYRNLQQDIKLIEQLGDES